MPAPAKHTDDITVEDAKRPELPNGWASITLGDACLPVKKVSPTQRPDEAFTYLDIASIDNTQLRIVSPKTHLGKTAPSRARQTVKAGSVLFSTVRTYLKNIAMVPAELDGQIASTGFCVLSPSDQINARFVFYFVQHDEFVAKVNPIQRGTSYPAVRDSDVLAQTFPLPPFLEQHRIVAEIEKQFTRLDASVAALKRVQANLKRYRASVLKAACEGKLVPIEAELAKAEGRDYEHASVLLECILTERRARWESQEKRRGKYKEPVVPDTADLPDLPEGWVWATLDQLATIGTGSTPLTSRTEFYQDGSVPWVTSSALNDPIVSAPSNYVTQEAVKEYRLSLYPIHTLLVAMYGEGKTRGKCSELMCPSTINQAIAAVTMEDSADHCRAYSKVFLHSNYEATRRLSSGGVQPNLNLGLIKGLAMPLPPLAEQTRIVAEVERRLSVIQQAESTVEANLARAERLRQSILKQAFSGKLVPQDPNDEPASVLLERIRAEREEAKAAAMSNGKPRRGRSRKSDRRQGSRREAAP